ncbi:MAG TPA: transposase, partial [Candidatus Baltobacteraceae bacterium]
AVRAVLAGKKTRAQIARELGIRADLLFKWQGEFAPDSTIELGPENNSSIEAKRIRQLERELATVKEERDILKKATAFFAKDHH